MLYGGTMWTEVMDGSPSLVGMFLREACQHDLLSHEETLSLIRRYQEHADYNARNHVVMHNLKLVVSVARRYVGRGMELNELIQEGNLGLIRALDDFDCDKGYQLSTYAYFWIKQAINRALADKSRMIRLPVHFLEQLSLLLKVRTELRIKLFREPEIFEIAQAAGIPYEQAKNIMLLSSDATIALSLDQPVEEEKPDLPVESTIVNRSVAKPSQQVEYLEQLQAVREKIDSLKAKIRDKVLNEKHGRMFLRRFGLDDASYELRLFSSVAKQFGVTSEAVRQVEVKLLKMLRMNKEQIIHLLSAYRFLCEAVVDEPSKFNIVYLEDKIKARGKTRIRRAKR